MLLKEELKKSPPCELKLSRKKDFKQKVKYASAARICDILRCGKILTVDYYSIDSKELQVRFFSDGHNYIIYVLAKDEWTRNSITKILDCYEVGASAEDINITRDFLGISDKSTWIYSCGHTVQGIIASCEGFIQKKRSDENEKKRDKRQERKEYHLSLFPSDYSKTFDRYCKESLFSFTYIFFTKLDKKRMRKGVCGHCGKSINLPCEVKHNQLYECPKCHRKAILCAGQYFASKTDKADLCVAYNRNGQLLLEWFHVKRSYGDKYKSYFEYDPFCRTLYISENGKNQIFTYEWVFIQAYWGSYWGYKGKDYVPHKLAMVYTDDLNDVFGERYYNVNLKSILSLTKQPIDFTGLLDNLKNIPAAEYLCKLGLVKLASEIFQDDINSKGKSFSEVLGVSKQYLPMYKELEIGVDEHRVLQVAKDYVTTDLMQKYRNLQIKSKSTSENVTECLDVMTLQKFCTYMGKEKNVYPGTETRQIIGWLKDYINMSNELEVPLTKRNLFPADIKKAHDLLLPRYQLIRNEVEERASKEALSLINDFFTGYEKEGFSILVPKTRNDFVKEGQVLSHCVGGESYYKNHISGKRMIFFIRHSEDIETPFYTAEIEMIGYKVTQLYGFGDSRPPTPVNKFTKEFAKWLKSQNEIQRKAG